MENQTAENVPVAEPVGAHEHKSGHHEPSSGRAIATLVLGILSIMCAGFLTGVPAIIIGNMEMKDIRAGKSGRQNEGITKVGFILGIIGTALTCIMTLITVIFVMLAVSFGGFEAIRSSVGSV
jgi:magnesium-transporting ATPase (P-type)